MIGSVVDGIPGSKELGFSIFLVVRLVFDGIFGQQ